MAATLVPYGQLMMKALNKEIDFDGDTIKVMLCTSAFTPNQDTQVYKSSVTNEIANGNGYTTGGATLTNKSITYDAATNTIKIDADDTVWPEATITARYAVMYDDTPATDAEKPLICYIDFGADTSSTAANFTITWNEAGIIGIVTN